MNTELINSLKNSDREKTEEAVRDMIKKNIKLEAERSIEKVGV